MYTFIYKGHELALSLDRKKVYIYRGSTQVDWAACKDWTGVKLMKHAMHLVDAYHNN